jgi:nucleoside-diphosphate-sugar epimerase
MKPRRVLVTGAGGFVGNALALGFARLDWEVIGLDRSFDAAWEDDGIRQVTAELADGVPSDVPGVDLVVHAAWTTTDAETLGVTAAAYVALNVRPLLAVLEYSARTRPAAFVFLSSSGVFGLSDGDEGLTDAHQPTGASPYAVAKRAGELLVPVALEKDTAGHVMRLGYLFGPGEVARPSRLGVSQVAGWVNSAREGHPLAVRADDPRRDWTFIADLAAALERTVDGPAAARPVHLGSPHVLSDSAFATLIASQLSGPNPVRASATGQVKPPMVPSDIPALRDFAWTSPDDGLRVLLAREVRA